MLPGKGTVCAAGKLSYTVTLFAYLVPFAWKYVKGRNSKWTAKSSLWRFNISDSIIHSNQFVFMLYPSDQKFIQRVKSSHGKRAEEK